MKYFIERNEKFVTICSVEYLVEANSKKQAIENLINGDYLESQILHEFKDEETSEIIDEPDSWTIIQSE